MNRSSDFVHDQVQELGQLVERAVPDGGVLELLAPDVRRKLAPVLHRAPEAVARLALLGDCLVLAERAMQADGAVSADELTYVMPLVRAAAPYFAQVRDTYATLDVDAADGARSFFEVHCTDRMLFGGACSATAWLGLELCHRASKHAGDHEVLDRYESLVARLLDEVFAIGGLSAVEAVERTQLRDLVLRRSKLQGDAPVGAGPDPREQAFLLPSALGCFQAVASASQVFDSDPADVDTIHGCAREIFARSLDSLIERGRRGPGRVLLLLGEAGSGKTHLMRAFRAHVHGKRLGVVGYMQMTVGSEDYGRYALGRLIESLERPHSLPEVEDSSLLCLSDALAKQLDPDDRDALREDDLPPEVLLQFARTRVDSILEREGFGDIDPDLICVLLLLQRRTTTIRSRVARWLRCEPLGEYDARLLGGVVPRTREEDPLRMIEHLARVLRATGQGALVLLIDQLEDLENLDDTSGRFRRAIDVVRHVIEQSPNALVVVACLEDFWFKVRDGLVMAVRDRVERDPEPHHLATHRTAEEVEALVSRRLELLCADTGARFRPDEPVFPFKREELAQLAAKRTRDVLYTCHVYQERCVMAQRLLPWLHVEQTAPLAPTGDFLARAWNDARANQDESVPESDAELAALLAWSLDNLGPESEGVRQVMRSTRFIDVDLEGASGALGLAIGLCNHDARGGALSRQIEEVVQRAGKDRRVVIVRGSEYPSRARTAIVEKLGELIRAGGRRVVVEDAEWRTIMALKSFLERNRDASGLAEFRRNERPLTSLPAIRAIVAEDLAAITKPSSALPPPAAAEPSTSNTRAPIVSAPAPRIEPRRGTERPPATARLRIGVTRGISPTAVELEPRELVTHAAFLGAPGSGKTTLALHVMEQLLERGISCVLVDRKGDLAGYADPSAWARPLSDAAAESRRERLRGSVCVDLFTPGHPAGRGLSIPLVPAGIGSLPSHERAQLAGWAATALGAMMGFRGRADEQQRVILQKAIEVISELRPNAVPQLQDLIGLLDEQDAALVDAVGRLDAKHFRRLVEQLETLRLGRGHLFGASGEELDVERIFAPTADGRARITIISTKFLGDHATIEFWVSRFLLALARWASKNPSPSLQGALFLDEADIYLPATSKPPTKEPLQDLLRRARSAGLSVLLATQNPGDLDYKGRDNIRTWWIGRVTSNPAIEKMKPLLSDARTNVSGKLPNLGIGEFFQLAGGQVTHLRADRSLLETVQLAEGDIERLASATRP